MATREKQETWRKGEGEEGERKEGEREEGEGQLGVCV